MNSNLKLKRIFKMSPAKYILLGFAVLILVGAFLLCLPISNVNGQWLSFVDALFSATTSVCVTGLMTIDIATELTLFGEIIILILIQFGGLGFVTVASLLYMLIGKKINYNTRLTIQESLNTEDSIDTVKMVKQILLITAICELAGMIALAPSLVSFTGNFWSGCYKALFLSVSAFCHAGVDSLGPLTPNFSNVSVFANNPFVLIPLIILIFIGGIGFIVIVEIFNKTFKKKKLTLHSKIVLSLTSILVLLGACVFMFAEWNNPETIGTMTTGNKIINSFFHSINTRTAGFSAIDQSALNPITVFFSILLMFIGGSPMSVAGGIKTTTFFVILLLLFRNQDQNGNIIYKGKKISHKVITKAVRIALIALALLLAGIVLIFILEGGAFSIVSITYDVISAICTVGLSFGITPYLGAFSKLILITLMYVGRVGLLTIPLAFKTKETNASIEYVSAKIIVG